MFYYPNVLQRHTGCFSTIWLAATRGAKILKREYMKVNVINTCQKIKEYILQQVPAPYIGSDVPRLSLYLSAQLSYGVVCVYHRQCDLLIEEIKSILERLHRAEKQLKIDLLQPDQQVLLPDPLRVMEMLENAPDPFFGMMGIPPELPDPLMIPQIRSLLEMPSPEISRREKTPPRLKRARKEDVDHVTSPESITLREVELVAMPEMEVVPDIPEVSVHDLEFFMSDLPPFPQEDVVPEPRLRETIKPDKEPKEKPKEREEKPKEPVKIDVQLEEVERERERLLKSILREREILWEAERERMREIQRKRESDYQKMMARDKERLRKALEEIKRLKEAGAESELVKEKIKEIERLKNLLKKRKEEWEAERLREQLRESEREREHMQETQRDRERLAEAEREIARLRRILEEREQEKKPFEADESADVVRKMEAETLTVKLSPTTRLREETIPELEGPILLDETTGQPILFFPEISSERSPLLVSPLLPPTGPSSPQLMLPEVDVSQPSVPLHVVRESHLIIDKVTQIDRKKMEEQIKMPHLLTKEAVPVAIPHKNLRTLETLFNRPTYPHWMAPELSALWTRGAMLEQLPYTEESEEETMSELEVVRAVTESGISALISSEMSLEVSEEERSRPLHITPEERRAISAEGERFLPIVSEMPELIVELPETDEVVMEDLQRKLFSDIDNLGQSEFLSLTPRSLSRLLVSRFFYSCLVLCTQRIIRLEQAEPYGQILITPGEQYAHK
ncbi:meiotic recombination protein REC8 homolog [Spea bombifrons]|uniref:meiotic recombination protein REC8 homolog n=1 Tax=Spea bombifrons TaxID=233779 RepID=UPI0023498997|nr:meiotic recombination protein REC8 homolog [Spea bombifrons]